MTAPVAILPLNSYTQEATNSEQSDIRVIRTTRDLLCTQGLCRAAGALPSGQATACLS